MCDKKIVDAVKAAKEYLDSLRREARFPEESYSKPYRDGKQDAYAVAVYELESIIKEFE